MTPEEKAILAKAEEIQQRELERKWAAERARQREEFTLIHDEEGYRVYRRNTTIVQWWLYYGDELITTSQYRKGIFGALNHILSVKHICLGLIDQ